jgi:stage V sporulation protein AD
MAGKKVGQTFFFEKNINICAVSSFAGKKEGQGPLKKYFDNVVEDDMYGESTWEKAESKFVKEAFKKAVEKANLGFEEIDYIVCGDLLNQCSGTVFGTRDMNIPFFGVYGACSTFGESISLGSMLIESGCAKTILAGTSSHFCSAEKQFRFPLALGTQRPLSSTWTVTGSGAAVLKENSNGPKIECFTAGKIIDMGITDASNMGAAMAGAAVDTIVAHLKDTGRDTDYYDVIATGDLGYVGRDILIKYIEEQGYKCGSNITDCGIEIFDREKQDTHSGGSGCACSALTYCGYFHKMIEEGSIKRMLFVPTGAMMSSTSGKQGESIPSIAYAISIERQ